MGKAALDLPDPLQTPPDAQAKTSTDDLLARLAGEEIDRLLAEADADESAPASPSFPPAPPTADAPTAPFAADPIPAPTAQPAPSRAQALDVNAELDVLFSAAVAKDAEAANAASPPPETTAEERAGLVAEPARGHSPAAAGDAREESLPLLLRPLEWLSAPLAVFPESVRDFIGKVAIITTLNAAAVLAYVLIFRRG